MYHVSESDMQYLAYKGGLWATCHPPSRLLLESLSPNHRLHSVPKPPPPLCPQTTTSTLSPNHHLHFVPKLRPGTQIKPICTGADAKIAANWIFIRRSWNSWVFPTDWKYLSRRQLRVEESFAVTVCDSSGRSYRLCCMWCVTNLCHIYGQHIWDAIYCYVIFDVYNNALLLQDNQILRSISGSSGRVTWNIPNLFILTLNT